MSDLEDLVAKLKLDISDFEKNAKKAEGATDDLAKKTTEAATSNDKWGQSFDRVMNAFTGINQGIQLVQQVLGGLKKGYDAVVTSTAAYAESIYHASNLAGVSTEQMSRLVQAADDFRVSQETLTGAMGMALKNGFVPTIDNIAALSDELLAIKDPAERAGRATEIFGRQWEGVMPFLLQGGDAIREATGSIEDNLIVTDDAAKNAMEYAAQVDALSDAWTGLKMNAGEAVLPIVIQILTEMNQSNQLSGLREQYGKNLRSLMLLGQISQDQYNEAMKLAYDRTMPVADAVDYLSGKVEESGEQISFVAQKTDDWASANYDVGYSYEGITKNVATLTEAEIAAADAVAAMQAQIAAEHESITSLGSNYTGIISLAYEYTDMLGEIDANNAKLAAMTPWQREHSQAGKDLIQANKDIEASMAKLANKVTLDMFQATIAVGGVTQAELQAYMKMAIDMGLMSEEGAKAAMEAYGGAIEYIDGLNIDEKTGNVNIDATAAFFTLDLLQQYSLLDKQMRVFVKTYYGTSPNSNYDPYEDYTGPTYDNPNGGASGTTVLPGQTVRWGEYGPETFVASASGRILSRADSMNAVGQAEQGDEYDSDLLQALVNIPTAKDIARAVRDAILLAGG